MFDLRYHVASLAAVFIALAVGIVIGVAIASGNGVNKATKDLQQAQVNSLKQQLAATRVSAQHSADEQRAVGQLMENAYPTLMAGRLADKRVAVLYLGGPDGGISSAIDQTLTDAGPVTTASVTSLKLPVDTDAIDAAIGSDAKLASLAGASNLRALGQTLATELVAGGQTPLWGALRETLVDQRTGAILDPVDGVVVVRTWLQAKTTDQQRQEREAQTEELIKGLLDGLRSSGIPAVGVAATGGDTTDGDPLSVFRDLGISTVDDVEELPGRVALALLLAGGQPGDYGVGDGADGGVAPPIEPVAATTGVG